MKQIRQKFRSSPLPYASWRVLEFIQETLDLLAFFAEEGVLVGVLDEANYLGSDLLGLMIL